MATLTVTHNFVNGTTADAEQVDTNFADVTTFVNNEVIQKDGSKAMTGNLTLVAGDPLPRGFKGQDVATAEQTGITGEVTLKRTGSTPLEVVFTGDGVRRYRVTAQVPIRYGTTEVAQVNLRIKEGGAGVGATSGQTIYRNWASNERQTFTWSTIVVPTASSHTYGITAETLGANTFRIENIGSPLVAATIYIEDIGI